MYRSLAWAKVRRGCGLTRSPRPILALTSASATRAALMPPATARRRWRPDPVWIAEDRDEDQRRAALVSQLPAHQRLVLNLQAQGYSYQQICLATGKTYTWVNRHLHEGRARLRRLAEPG
jgi:DNA-directed RNA polymerase specialized sigma24 family protein